MGIYGNRLLQVPGSVHAALLMVVMTGACCVKFVQPWFLPRPRQDVIGTNLVSHSDFVRLLVRVLVLVDVFLCQCVDVIVGIVGDLYNLSTQRNETIRILGILDAECDVAVATHIFIFNAAFCAINREYHHSRTIPA